VSIENLEVIAREIPADKRSGDDFILLASSVGLHLWCSTPYLHLAYQSLPVEKCHSKITAVTKAPEFFLRNQCLLQYLALGSLDSPLAPGPFYHGDRFDIPCGLDSAPHRQSLVVRTNCR